MADTVRDMTCVPHDILGPSNGSMIALYLYDRYWCFDGDLRKSQEYCVKLFARRASKTEDCSALECQYRRTPLRKQTTKLDYCSQKASRHWSVHNWSPDQLNRGPLYSRPSLGGGGLQGYGSIVSLFNHTLSRARSKPAFYEPQCKPISGSLPLSGKVIAFHHIRLCNNLQQRQHKTKITHVSSWWLPVLCARRGEMASSWICLCSPGSDSYPHHHASEDLIQSALPRDSLGWKRERWTNTGLIFISSRLQKHIMGAHRPKMHSKILNISSDHDSWLLQGCVGVCWHYHCSSTTICSYRLCGRSSQAWVEGVADQISLISLSCQHIIL